MVLVPRSPQPPSDTTPHARIFHLRGHLLPSIQPHFFPPCSPRGSLRTPCTPSCSGALWASAAGFSCRGAGSVRSQHVQLADNTQQLELSPATPGTLTRVLCSAAGWVRGTVRRHSPASGGGGSARAADLWRGSTPHLEFGTKSPPQNSHQQRTCQAGSEPRSTQPRARL